MPVMNWVQVPSNAPSVNWWCWTQTSMNSTSTPTSAPYAPPRAPFWNALSF